MKKLPPLLTADVARRLDVTPKTVHQLEQKGHLTAERTASGTRLFNQPDVERLARERAAARDRTRQGNDQ
jgi:DNA-binding transcriptional MerR regulator